ncbi:MAG: sugar phosphate isomerase/epimerase [Clostridiales bacterium]|nr:sugar phosphate isomerase/epimerase [Clostridiales bacterium]
MKHVPVGYQLYSAREEAQKDLAGVLKGLKEMGYDGVEFAGFYGNSAETVKQLLDENGLVAVSSHVPVASIEEDMFGTIAYHLTIGCKYIAIPYLDDAHRPGTPGFADMLKLIYKFGRLCKEAGIQLLYHNHDFEFVQLSGMYGLDFLYAAVPPCTLKTEIDTCWVKYAGEDPAAYLRKYTGRAPVVHLKDFVGRKGEGTPYGLIGQAKQADAVAFEFRPFGHGCQDAKSVVEAGIDAGAEWFVIEQDQWYNRHPLEAAKMSIDTLYDLGLKER